MKAWAPWLAVAVAVGLVGLGGCSDDAAGGGPADALVDVKGDDGVEDAGGDVGGDVGGGEVSEDAADGGDVADVGPTLVPRLVQDKTQLPQEFVFKGVWAGAPGAGVAVGNEGVVARREADGRWKVVGLGTGADLLNAVSGTGPDDLWAVGKDGVILHGTSDGFGQSGESCAVDADCAGGDPCVTAQCVQGGCVSNPSLAPGCCGAPAGVFGFDSGKLEGWVVTKGTTPVTWHVVSRAGRHTSPSHALYFGDPSKNPPNFTGTGIVSGVVESPVMKLPAAGSAVLTFQLFMDTESGTSWDKLEVFVKLGGAQTLVWDKAQLPGMPTGGFVPVELDLSAWMGQSVQVVFAFDSVDSAGNGGEGVYVDDVRVDTTCSEGVGGSLGTLWGVHAVTPEDAWAVGLQGTMARWDGQRWRNVGGAEGVGKSWRGMAGGADTLVLVGDGGAITVSDGGVLSDVASPTTATLYDVHSADGQTFWAVGASGTVLKGQGTEWSLVEAPAKVDLHAVWVRADGEVWVVGDGATALRGGDGGWEEVDVPTWRDLRAVWISDVGLVTITGADGVLVQGPVEGPLDASVTLAAGGELSDAFGWGETVLLVGNDSKVFRFAGKWAAEKPGTSQHLRSVWGTGPDDVWAVGWLLGTLLHWDGQAWTKHEAPTSDPLEVVWGRSKTEAYAAGANGTLLAWDGEVWRVTSAKTDQNLRAVFGRASDDVWAVGAGGTIMHYGGLGWAPSPIAPIMTADGKEQEITSALHAVWAAAEDDAWAVGADGQVLRWDGVVWTSVDPGFGVTLRGVYGLSADEVWAVGNEGHVIRWDGETWTPVPTGSVATLYAVHGDGDGHLLIVGDLGTVLRLEWVAAESE